MMPGSAPEAVIVMGPSGVGKTATARLLARRLSWEFAEGDDFHPPANVRKMASGTPLDDFDRAPWLGALRDWIAAQASAGRSIVLTCSALKRRYRDVLRASDPARVRFVMLDVAPEVIAERLATRTGHYMPPSLLASQLAALEPLEADEDGVRVLVDADADAVVEAAIAALGLKS